MTETFFPSKEEEGKRSCQTDEGKGEEGFRVSMETRGINRKT